MLFNDQNEISENEMESQESSNKLHSFNEYFITGEETQNNPFEDYEPKNLAGKDNLSSASNMNTPRQLALNSPMNLQQQRRFEKRNIPLTFSSTVTTQDKLHKYNMKTKEETEELIVSPSIVEGRNRRDPLARGRNLIKKLILNL